MAKVDRERVLNSVRGTDAFYGVETLVDELDEAEEKIERLKQLNEKAITENALTARAASWLHTKNAQLIAELYKA